MAKYNEEEMLVELKKFFDQQGGVLSQTEYTNVQSRAPYKLREIRKVFKYYSRMLAKLPVDVVQPKAPPPTESQETDSDE